MSSAAAAAMAESPVNISFTLAAHAVARPHHAALVVGDRTLTHADLGDLVARAARFFRAADVAGGQIVALLLRDQVALVVALLGLMRLGATPFPLAPSATPAQRDALLAAAACRLVFTDLAGPDLAPGVARPFATDLLQAWLPLPLADCPAAPVAPCLLVAGSGSTGQPRLMPLGHAVMQARFGNMTAALGLDADDRLMVAAALHLATPIYRLLAAIMAGATAIGWDQVTDLGAAIAAARPDLLHLSVYHAERLLLEHRRTRRVDLAALRVVSIGASTVSQELRHRLRDELGARLHINYGTNEAQTVTFAYPADLDGEPGCVGRPLPGVQVELVDEADRPVAPGAVGRVRVRSPAQIAGYLGGGDADRFRDGWFYPGDLGRWAADGQLVHCGRADDMMIVNGVNLYPAEIERAMAAHPAVRDCIALPLRDRVAQDLPVCAVTLRDGRSATPEDLQAFARRVLGARAPRAVAVLEAIPRNEQGKPQRAELVRHIRAGLARPAVAAPPPPGPVPRQRRRRIAFAFTLPAAADPAVLHRWCDVLETASLPAGHPAPPASGAAAWLAGVLRLARLLLLAARAPLFAPPVALDCRRAPAPAAPDDWQAIADVPHLDRLPASLWAVALEGALAAAGRMVAQPDPVAGRAALFDWLAAGPVARLARLLPGGKSSLPLLDAAWRAGMPFVHVGHGIYQIGWGARARRVDRSMTDADSGIGIRLVQHKAATAGLLRDAGLPAPVHEVVRTVEAARAAAVRLGWPVVVKPVDADRGEGVTVDVSDAGLDAAFARARQASPSRTILVERPVPGICHRLFIAGGRLLYAVRRLPPGVAGDGRATIAGLVAARQAARLALPPWRREPVLELDDPALACLAAQGLSPGDVPAAGRFVALRPIETTAWGGRDDDVDDDVTAIVHPDNLDAALHAARLCGLDSAGIDIVSADIARSWSSNGAAIIEVNAAPLLGGGAVSRHHVPAFLARLVPGDGRIPVEVLVGDGAALDVALARQRQARADGVAAWIATGDRVLAPDGPGRRLAIAGLHDHVRALVLDPAVGALLLVVQDDDLLATGLPLEGVDAVRVVNRALRLSVPAGGPARIDLLLRRLHGWTWPRAAFGWTAGTDAAPGRPAPAARGAAA